MLIKNNQLVVFVLDCKSSAVLTLSQSVTLLLHRLPTGMLSLLLQFFL